METVESRSRADYIRVFLKGMAMGAADVVPGVSGGTVAFITGIYEELLQSIRGIDLGLLKLLREQGIAAMWKAANGNFLLVLLSGILFSIVSLARIITHLLENHSEMIWSFFFGLIVASVIYIAKQIRRWSLLSVVLLLIGAACAAAIGFLKPANVEYGYWYVFLSGAVAICAMILPGISGSFILVLLGMYAPVLAAIKGLDLVFVLVFALGCVIGLLSFARFLSWLLERAHDLTLLFLTGFLVGSLVLVWPWKHVISYYQTSKGPKPLTQENVLPVDYFALTGQEPYTLICICLMFAGLLLVLLLERFAGKQKQG